jgi:hypothetical protein
VAASNWGEVGEHLEHANQVARKAESCCVICGVEVDYEDVDWMEADGGGDICGGCIRDAEAEEDDGGGPDLGDYGVSLPSLVLEDDSDADYGPDW